MEQEESSYWNLERVAVGEITFQLWIKDGLTFFDTPCVKRELVIQLTRYRARGDLGSMLCLYVP